VNYKHTHTHTLAKGKWMKRWKTNNEQCGASPGHILVQNRELCDNWQMCCQTAHSRPGHASRLARSSRPCSEACFHLWRCRRSSKTTTKYQDKWVVFSLAHQQVINLPKLDLPLLLLEISLSSICNYNAMMFNTVCCMQNLLSNEQCQHYTEF